MPRLSWGTKFTSQFKLHPRVEKALAMFVAKAFFISLFGVVISQGLPVCRKKRIAFVFFILFDAL